MSKLKRNFIKSSTTKGADIADIETKKQEDVYDNKSIKKGFILHDITEVPHSTKTVSSSIKNQDDDVSIDSQYSIDDSDVYQDVIVHNIENDDHINSDYNENTGSLYVETDHPPIEEKIIDTFQINVSKRSNFQNSAIVEAGYSKSSNDSKREIDNRRFKPSSLKFKPSVVINDTQLKKQDKSTVDQKTDNELSKQKKLDEKASSKTPEKTFGKNKPSLKSSNNENNIVLIDKTLSEPSFLKTVERPFVKRKRRGSSRNKGDAFNSISNISVNMIMSSSDLVFDDKSITNDQQKRRSKKYKKQRYTAPTSVTYPSTISVHIPISVADLAKKLKRKAKILSSFLTNNVSPMKVDDMIVDSYVLELIGDHFSCEIKIDDTLLNTSISKTSIYDDLKNIDESKLAKRPPIVTLMGHVDHGKTSIIDFYRKSNIVEHEHGKITQNIGAFEIETKFSKITIIDTPGHSAFSLIRSKGVSIADVAVIVVAGDEGVKEQTIESINAARASNIAIIVAATKSDKPEFNLEKIYSDLSSQNLISEAWGGDIMVVPCSTVTGNGMQELAESIALYSDILEIKYDINSNARGFAISAIKSQKEGPRATIVVKNGCLKKNDIIVFQSCYGKVRNIRNQNNEHIDNVIPCTPVEIFGISGIPSAGEEFIVVESLSKAKTISESLLQAKKTEELAINADLAKAKSLQDQNNEEMAEDDIQTINIIVKAITNDTLSAVFGIINGMEFNRTKINIVASGIGCITENDIDTALIFNAVIIGFQTKFVSDKEAKKSESKKVRTIIKDVIYRIPEAIQEIAREKAGTKVIYEKQALLEILAIFKSSKIGKIAGCRVVDGTISRNHVVNVIRNGNTVIEFAKINSMKTEKNDIKESPKGTECGLVLQDFDDFVIGDMIQSFSTKVINKLI